MRMILPPMVLAVLTACTPTPQQAARAVVEADATQAKLAKALSGLTPGKPMSCMSQLQSTNLEAYGPTLLYRVSRSLVYRNDTAGGCERAGRDDILVTRSPTGQLCRGDIAQTFDRGSRFPTGGCSLGDFVPYRKP